MRILRAVLFSGSMSSNDIRPENVIAALFPSQPPSHSCSPAACCSSLATAADPAIIKSNYERPQLFQRHLRQREVDLHRHEDHAEILFSEDRDRAVSRA